MAANERWQPTVHHALLFVVILFHMFENGAPEISGEICPQLYPDTFDECIPKDGQTAGTYKEYQEQDGAIPTIEECILACCKQSDCNIIMYAINKTKPEEATCYHVSGFSFNASIILY